jgi:hypothetical protein
VQSRGGLFSTLLWYHVFLYSFNEHGVLGHVPGRFFFLHFAKVTESSHSPFEADSFCCPILQRGQLSPERLP